MEKRPFGRTGHISTVAILGCAAFGKVDQPTADNALKLAFEHGVNHFDFAPSYGHAEERLAPWMKTHRDDIFLGCKTMERAREGALEELQGSLKRLNAEYFDLYQLHAVKKIADLDEVTSAGGALEALVEAQQKGLIRYIGITGHGVLAPTVFIEALQRFDFDSVLFPVNFIQYADPVYKQYADTLLKLCREKNVGSMLIKTIAKAPWGDRKPAFDTWYEPFTEPERIHQAVSFALSQEASGICTAGDTRLLSLVLDACENYSRLTESQQSALIQKAALYQPLFA